MFKGGFMGDINFFIQKGVSLFTVDPTPPVGNPTLPVSPFPYIQNK